MNTKGNKLAPPTVTPTMADEVTNFGYWNWFAVELFTLHIAWNSWGSKMPTQATQNMTQLGSSGSFKLKPVKTVPSSRGPETTKYLLWYTLVEFTRTLHDCRKSCAQCGCSTETEETSSPWREKKAHKSKTHQKTSKTYITVHVYLAQV